MPPLRANSGQTVYKDIVITTPSMMTFSWERAIFLDGQQRMVDHPSSHHHLFPFVGLLVKESVGVLLALFLSLLAFAI